MSEKAKTVVSPVIYWQLSLLGSLLLSLYGWLRGDFAIIFGQFFSYYIYIWNLNAKDSWKIFPAPLRHVITAIPIVALCYFITHVEQSLQHLFGTIQPGLLIFGSVGQMIFTLRFIYQWWYSRSHHESLLPRDFWAMSILGSALIIIYGVIRHDPVLILGQSVGFIVYIRNFYLATRQKI